MDVRIRVTFTGQFLLCLFQYRSERAWVMNISVALKLGTDGAGTGTPEVVAYDPVALVFEHALVEGFHVASMSG